MEIKEEKVGDIANGQPAATAPVTEEVQTEQKEEQKIDYQALYEQERQKLEKAEFTLYRKNKEEKAKKQQLEVTPSVPSPVIDREEEKRRIEEEVQALFDARSRKEAEDTIEEELMNLSDDPDERKLIRLKYDNVLHKTGYTRSSIRQDLEDAKFLANKVRFIKEREELAQTAVSKRTMGNSGVGASVQKPMVQEDLSKQFSPQDWAFMQKRKWSEAQIREALQNRSK